MDHVFTEATLRKRCDNLILRPHPLMTTLEVLSRVQQRAAS